MLARCGQTLMSFIRDVRVCVYLGRLPHFPLRGKNDECNFGDKLWHLPNLHQNHPSVYDFFHIITIIKVQQLNLFTGGLGSHDSDLLSERDGRGLYLRSL